MSADGEPKTWYNSPRSAVIGIFLRYAQNPASAADPCHNGSSHSTLPNAFGRGWTQRGWRVAVALALAFAALSMTSNANEAGGFDRSPRRSTHILQLQRTQQLVVITTADWDATSGQMQCFQRADGAWREVWPQSTVSVGRTGLAWGLGLHGGTPAAGGPVKREGDGKAPAGVFPLTEAFGFASAKEAKIARFPYRQLTDKMEGIDDPKSRYYNRIVDRSSIAAPDWNSSERMRVLPYRWGAVVGHNPKQVPGAGSCIFLHVWEGVGVATSGCTAMPEDQMLRLLRWLDRSKEPILVQLPVEEYRRLRESWRLP